MAGDAGLTAERGKIADRARARDSGLRDQNRVAANDNVVSDLDEIVDFRPLADHRIAVCASVDRHARADLDVVLNDDSPDLRHFEMSPRAEGEAKSVLPDMSARVNDHAIPNQRRDDRRRRADGAVAPDPHVGTNDGVRADDRARADLGAAPITAPGSTTTPDSSRAAGWTKAAGETPVSLKIGPGLTAVGNSFAIAIAIAR